MWLSRVGRGNGRVDIGAQIGFGSLGGVIYVDFPGRHAQAIAGLSQFGLSRRISVAQL